MMPRPIEGDHRGMPPIVITRPLPRISPLRKGTVVTAEVFQIEGLPNPFKHSFRTEGLSTHNNASIGYVYQDTRYSGNNILHNTEGLYRLLIVSSEQFRSHPNRSASPSLCIEAVPLRQVITKGIEGEREPNQLFSDQLSRIVEKILGYNEREFIIHSPVVQDDIELFEALPRERLKELYSFLRMPGNPLKGLPLPEYMVRQRKR